MTIDKIAWIEIQDRKVLFVRTKGKSIFYTAGGKREAGESDQEALVREIKEEVKVDLVPETLRHLHTFVGPAHGQPEGTLVQLACYSGSYAGTLVPSSEIEELAWFVSTDTARTTPPGQMVLAWLKAEDLID